MPKDTSLKKILLIGSGPIVIGQGCEFDYSGVQACKALKEEGYEVVLVNSNPATIMTDPEFAHRTYIEPITPEIVEKIIEKEKPDALLPTLGGQTALNCAMKLFETGVLEKHGVKMIGANAAAIHKGEDRQAFKEAMIKIGLDMPRSGTAHTIEDARKVLAEIGTLPLIIRPAFTLGGSGGGIAYNREEFETIVARGLDLSPVSEVLVEESLLGWKEFEMEVMRDRNDNCVIICSIENVDPMGVHTGDSITVAPAQTLSDREFQLMRDASFAVIREIGVETGGSNIQFAVNPDTGRMIVIEMNPRVSRSSALASKATGFPIAKIAAKLAVGYTLDEVRNDITRETPASFEPTIDYVVVKVPRFTFEKFPQADATLTTQMKSVGEAMAIGRTFKEALQKALRSLEIKRFGLGFDGQDKLGSAVAFEEKDNGFTAKFNFTREEIAKIGKKEEDFSAPELFSSDDIDKLFTANVAANPFSVGRIAALDGNSELRRYSAEEVETIHRKLTIPNAERIFFLRDAFLAGMDIEQVAHDTPDKIFNEDRPLVSGKHPANCRGRHATARRSAVESEEARLLGPPNSDRLQFDGHRNSREAQRRWCSPHLPPRGHLRSRVRGLYAVLLLHLRRRKRAARLGQKEDHHSRWRSEPHWPGNRVRLLLRSRVVCAAGGGLRDHHGQLESRNRLHGL